MILAAYLIIGAAIAWRVLPFSRTALVVVLLWPWPIAGHLVYKVTGKYPRWMPPI